MFDLWKAYEGPDEMQYHRKFNIIWWSFLENSAWDVSSLTDLNQSTSSKPSSDGTEELDVESLHKENYEKAQNGMFL